MNFGQRSLSHPLLVEAIETEFHPVLVFNNKEPDAPILERFGEPSWNNPVVRYLDGDGEDVIPREDGVWAIHGTAARMVGALAAAERDVPPWLLTVADETAGDLETATFAMHCFWEGEAKLGRLDGVRRTRVGWVDGLEVVEVRFDEKALPFERLAERAGELDCATRVWAPDAARGEWRDAKPADDKHALRRSPLRHLPLTPGQATKVNAALRLGADARALLSPRQGAVLDRVDRALAADADALDGFEPPADPRLLAAYEDRLIEALDR